MIKIIHAIICFLALASISFSAVGEPLSNVEIPQFDSSLQKKYDDLFQKNITLVKTAESNIDLASKIIDWSAMIFAALAILIIIAGAVGLREFANFRSLREEMLDKLEKVNIEISEIRGIRKQVKDELDTLKKEVRNESDNIFKTIYLLNDAIVNFNSGNLQSSISTLKQIKVINPSDYEATCLLARAYSGQEKYQKAVEISKIAVDLSKKPYRAFYIMAENYRRMGKYDEAIEMHKKSLNIQPHAPTYNSLAYSYYRKKEFRLSEKEFRKSLEISRNSSGVVGIAKSLLMQGENERAIEYCYEAIVLAKEDIDSGCSVVWPYYNMASAYFILNKEKKCLEVIEASISITKKNKAQIHEQISDYKLMSESKYIDKGLFKKCISKWEKSI